MNTADNGRRIMAALGGLDGPTRSYLADLWLDYADHLAERGHTDVARLFLELGLTTGAGTTADDKVTADFVAIAAKLPAIPFDPTSN